jgi:outer membrane lipoprotein carrier protein
VNTKIFAMIASVGIFCSLSAAAFVSETSRAAESSPSAKSLAHLVEEHYRLPRTLRAVFLERFSEGPKQARIESGTVYFRRPGQMRWEYESPEKKLFLVDGKDTWFYVPFDHTVTKTPVKESSDWQTPLALLTRKMDFSRLCSQIDVISQPGVPADHSVLRCLPKGTGETSRVGEAPPTPPDQRLSQGEKYTSVLLEVNSATGELARIEIQEAGGIELEYRFGNWQTDVPLPPEMFRFQVPPGVAIVNGASL